MSEPEEAAQGEDRDSTKKKKKEKRSGKKKKKDKRGQEEQQQMEEEEEQRWVLHRGSGCTQNHEKVLWFIHEPDQLVYTVIEVIEVLHFSIKVTTYKTSK